MRVKNGRFALILGTEHTGSSILKPFPKEEGAAVLKNWEETWEAIVPIRGSW